MKSQGDGSFLDQVFPPAMRKLTVSSSSRSSWQLSREQNAYLSWLMTVKSIFCCYSITVRKSSTFQCPWNPLVHGRQTIDIRATAKEHANILPNLLEAHGLSGCDTVAPCYGIGKMKILKTLKQGNHSLSCLRDSNANGVFGKLPSHQMAVAIIVLIGKKIREINFGYRALPYILCAYKYIQCL